MEKQDNTNGISEFDKIKLCTDNEANDAKIIESLDKALFDLQKILDKILSSNENDSNTNNPTN